MNTYQENTPQSLEEQKCMRYMEFNPTYRHTSNEKEDDDKDEEEEEEEEKENGPCRPTSGVRTIYFPNEAFGVNDALDRPPISTPNHHVRMDWNGQLLVLNTSTDTEPMRCRRWTMLKVCGSWLSLERVMSS